MMHLPVRITATFLLASLYSGCNLFIPKATTPISTQTYPAISATTPKSKALMIMLPGIGNRASAFADKGFIAELQAQHPNMEIITAEAHFGYYKERTVTTRLKEDIIKPAQQQGYNSIWLTGTSLGGFGSLLYTMEHPQDIAGIIAIAPYLGDKKLIADISQAPSLQQWARNYQGNDEIALSLWIPLIQKSCEAKNLNLILATGSEDKFIKAHKLLAQCLPASNVHITHGKHRWGTWNTLWQNILNEKPSFTKRAH
ncbi:serine aminopeptidase domain-containing protein [Marinagarivorans cellulosilyticus]|uniref:Alpha/beta hydrolase n=1 Tax=Marinagarivorans cellulosilyticus TaxID=2721545 RepID=A0AAN1WHY5_9GAMM|nr:alpha/beta hydrolase [Marinagarivorans cellulosilyticus]BCD97943.1 hypothetical protein MARGE09_P2144 [Marinagarivorans cellulosilyticus]